MNKPIQIVRKDGSYLGVAMSPKDAILNNQIRLVSRVIISNGVDRFLLQKRAGNMFVYPGAWDTSAAGHVDEGEEAEGAAYRELYEEIGISDIKLTKIYEYYDEIKENHGFVSKTYSHVYAGSFTGDISVLKIENTEVSEVRWFTKDELTEIVSHTDKVTEGLKNIAKELN